MLAAWRSAHGLEPAETTTSAAARSADGGSQAALLASESTTASADTDEPAADEGGGEEAAAPIAPLAPGPPPGTTAFATAAALQAAWTRLLVARWAELEETVLASRVPPAPAVRRLLAAALLVSGAPRDAAALPPLPFGGPAPLDPAELTASLAQPPPPTAWRGLQAALQTPAPFRAALLAALQSATGGSTVAGGGASASATAASAGLQLQLRPLVEAIITRDELPPEAAGCLWPLARALQAWSQAAAAADVKRSEEAAEAAAAAAAHAAAASAALAAAAATAADPERPEGHDDGIAADDDSGSAGGGGDSDAVAPPPPAEAGEGGDAVGATAEAE